MTHVWGNIRLCGATLNYRSKVSKAFIDFDSKKQSSSNKCQYHK